MRQDVNLLLIEDEEPMRRSLHHLLRQEGYTVAEASTGSAGLSSLGAMLPDVVLLDLGLPDIPGSEIISRIRGQSSVPIIVISARDQAIQKVEALDSGANDYVTKPFSAPELLARIRAALRVSDGRALEPRVFRTGELEVDLQEQSAFLAGQRVDLSSVEFRLLRALVRARGSIATHRELLEEVWGGDSGDRVHYLRVYMKRLRNKLEANPSQPKYLLTELGVGYRLAFER